MSTPDAASVLVVLGLAVFGGSTAVAARSVFHCWPRTGAALLFLGFAVIGAACVLLLILT
jgi:hypothetical protein